MSAVEPGFAAVTGAGQGIGRGIATELARRGVPVLVTDRDGERAARTSADLVADGLSADSAIVDVRHKDSIGDALRHAAETFERPLGIFVNNAGYTQLADPMEITAEQWDAMMQVNARGTLFGLQSAAEVIRDGGAIVNVSSSTARGPYVSSAHYAASKAAVLSLTMTFAAALAPRRVRVNAVAPAIVDTELWDVFDLELADRDGLVPGTAKQQRIDQIPIGRAGTPEDIALAVAFLADPANGYITGECVHLTGGSYMQ